ncbi:MAG: polysaccharide biosynthesis protein [Bacteroidales bacterium]|nr:polysaccharide biosynthesis protein [Bacteroidales bacterium]
MALDMSLSLVSSFLVFLATSVILGRELLDSTVMTAYLAAGFVTSAIMFILTRTYRIIIRHLGAKDIFPFFLSALVKGAMSVAVLALIGKYSNVVLLMGILDVCFTFVMLLGVRVAMIIGYQFINSRIKTRTDHQRILIYGTSDKSVAVIPRLQNSTHYKVMGFLERGTHTGGMLLERAPVYAFNEDKQLDKFIIGNGIDAILFAKDTDAQAEEDKLIKYCSEHGVKTLIVPGVDEVAEGQPFIRPREIKVEDLLGRKEIKISLDEIRANFSGKVVMVTGAAGSIGSELVRQLAGFGVKKLVLFDNAETPMHNLRLELEDKFPGLDFVPIIGDLRQVPRLDYAFKAHRPNVVFHAAAYKHVPLMEENPCEAIMVNTWGTRSVADRCIEYDVEKMVMISTDKAVNPTNIMGCTKRLAEIYVQSLGLAIERGQHVGKTKFVTTRFGNVLGSNGSVIPRFREQIAKGGPVTVTHPDINRFFMTIPEACRLVMEAATMSTGNQIFVFDMGEPVKIDYLARRMITLAGFVPDKDIKIEYSGLRPGEKLYEEVLSDKENTLPTFHERIRIAKVREYEYDQMLPIFSKLHHLAEDVKIDEMVRLMKDTVPEFKSENSRFKEMDK